MKKLISLAVLFSFLVTTGCMQKQQSIAVATVNGVEISSADFDNNLEQSIKIVQAQNQQSLQQPFAKDILGKRILQDMIRYIVSAVMNSWCCAAGAAIRALRKKSMP